MNLRQLPQAFKSDPWFATVVFGEALLIILGVALPILRPIWRPPVLSLLAGLTALRLFYLWGLATQQPKFHFPYIFVAGLFFLGTFGLGQQLISGLSGDIRYPLNWGHYLAVFAWVVRISGVSWYLVRGRHIQPDRGISPGTFMAIGIPLVLILAMFTPLAFVLFGFDRLIYGMQIEGM